MKTYLKRVLVMFLSIAAALALSAPGAWAQVKVACIGDSITFGYGLANPGTQSYPAQLQALLGSGYVVGNFGVNGATVQKGTAKSYWRTSQYRNSKAFAPNVVVIMLGTNDSKSSNWDAAKFNTDYRALIADYWSLATQPEVFVCLIPPVYSPNAFGPTFDPVFIQNTVVPAIRTIASQTGMPLIDNNSPLLNHPEYFSDGVHPNAQGAGIIASTVAAAVTAP
ncbi:MAG TPA: GDSL-type esterase/lipase family protein [Lacunisphaera sp.]